MADESIDIAKMLIGILILMSLISAIFMLYNLIFFNYNARVDKMRQATSSYAAQRMYELADDSQVGKPTKVTNAVSMLKDFGDDVLLYVAIDTQDDFQAYAYQSSKALLDAKKDNVERSQSATVIGSEVPVEAASKKLLTYSNCDCYVQIIGFTYEGNQYEIAQTGLDGNNNTKLVNGYTVAADADKHTVVDEYVSSKMQEDNKVASRGHYDAIALVFHVLPSEGI